MASQRCGGSKEKCKWRVCADYTDPNESCLKDSFPLPRIDQIVDAAAGHIILSFLGTFSRYHQILMHSSNIEKRAFITPHDRMGYTTMM